MFDRLVLSATFGWVIGCVGTLAHAQENVGAVQVFGLGGEGGAPVKIEGGPGMVISSSAGFGAAGIDPNNKSALLQLLDNESIRRELKLTEEQAAGAKRISVESNRRMAEMIREVIQAGRSPRDAGFRELMAENRKQAEAAIEEILLPQQTKRIRQLAYQVEIAKLGLAESLTEGRLGKEIGVTDNQKQHLIEKAAAVEAEARTAIAKIRAAAQAKLLTELSSEQRQAAEELLGEFFLFEEPTLEQRIRQNIKAQTAQPAKALGQ